VTLDALGARHGVMLLSFAPGPSKQQQYFIEFRFPVNVRGTFHNIGKFLAALALEQRLYNVFNVNYPEPAGASGEMQATFELVSYQYKEG
jgi:Tfp pilus assembly protein PilO